MSPVPPGKGTMDAEPRLIGCFAVPIMLVIGVAVLVYEKFFSDGGVSIVSVSLICIAVAAGIFLLICRKLSA